MTDFADDGWDCRAVLVDGRWVDRTPRAADREPQLRREVALLPWLGPLLPLPVPDPVVVAESPLTVRHALLAGGPCPGTSSAHGAAVGGFLRALHGLDPAEAVRRGAPDASASHAARLAVVGRMRVDVLPLLPPRLVAAGTALLERVSVPPSDPRLTHGDLGPSHLRVVGERVTGVIDWGDAAVGDPAIDLAWTAFGAGPAFREALLAAYAPSPALLARGRDLHLLGPWHEVLHGLGPGDPSFVTSGLAGVVGRLEAPG
ncbi:macrolide 2'-phosphotransferase MphH [Nocardioides marinquilinus]|uniref:Macrolide 2'-phosphotransferase MphH n=1 Tax=Nocardioides marinquilinus TaxID=1210400 RepID=A0ABP9PSI0_9ACTN